MASSFCIINTQRRFKLLDIFFLDGRRSKIIFQLLWILNKPSSSGSEEIVTTEKKKVEVFNDDDILEGVSKITCIVKSSPEVGRYLVSRKRLKEGDTVLIDEPLVVGPCQDSKTVCIVCCTQLKTDIASAHRCGGCGWPICGGGCPGITEKRSITRGGHVKAECRLLKTCSDSLSPTSLNMVVPLRCLLLRQEDPKSWSKLIRMESHDAVRRQIPNIWARNQMTVVEPLMKLDSEFTEELIHTVCGILEVNCFSVGAEGIEARALYPTAYLFQHDCTPNTTHIDSDMFTMTVRASVDIQQSVPITLSYTSTLYGTQRRRRELKESKFFDCCCSRCSSNTELGTYISAVKCTHCDKGWLLPDEPLIVNSQWKCCGCQQSVHYSFPVNLTERSSSDFECIKDGSIKDYEMLLSKYGKVLHPNHSTMLRIKYTLSQMYGKTEGYLLGNMTQELLKRKYDMCRDLLKVIDIIEPGMSRIRGVTLYECHAPLLLLTQLASAVGELSQKDLKRELRKVREMLAKSVAILSVERSDTTEGRLFKVAQEAFSQAQQWPI